MSKKKFGDKSTYDEIFEKYFDKDIIKSGTKYELLTALVIKHLTDSGKVIHDIRLRGESEVKHQIDVLFEDKGQNKRVLIECKDFDISDEKVGLGIVRDFSAVVDDVKPDEAFIFTCNDFTSGAAKFAKHKGIKLSILRNYTEKDNEGRILKIIIRITVKDATSPQLETVISEAEYPKLQADIEAEKLNPTMLSEDVPFFLNTPEGRHSLHNYVENLWKEHPREIEGPVRLKHELKDTTIEVANRGGVPILGLVLNFEVNHYTEIDEIVSDKIAELILEGFKDSDLIIFDQDLMRYDIDEESGEIKEKND